MVELRSSKPQMRVRVSLAALVCSTGVMVNATVLYTAESWFESRVEYKLRDLGSKVEQTVEARRVSVRF